MDSDFNLLKPSPGGASATPAQALGPATRWPEADPNNPLGPQVGVNSLVACANDLLYIASRIRHSQRIYLDGDVHTNTVEGFFGHFKTDVRGTHHAISTRWLPGYLNEWVWKWNHRNDDEAMFRSLIQNAAVAT